MFKKIAITIAVITVSIFFFACSGEDGDTADSAENTAAEDTGSEEVE
mgnify:CR=1 FL=1